MNTSEPGPTARKRQRYALIPTAVMRPFEATTDPAILVPASCGAALNWCGSVGCVSDIETRCPSLVHRILPTERSVAAWVVPLTGVLIVCFGLLQILDGWVTYYGLDQSLVDEVNPLLNMSARLFGLGFSILILKLFGLAFLAFLFADRHKMTSRWITATLGTVVTFYVWVVANNLTLVLAA